MMKGFLQQFAFNGLHRGCMGAEEELWTCHNGQLVAATPLLFPPGIETMPMRMGTAKPELPIHQVELVTGICSSVDELSASLASNRAEMMTLGIKHGFTLVAHPLPPADFELEVFPKQRYVEIKHRIPALVLRNAWVAGYHLHVGVSSLQEAILLHNVLREDLPLILALAACSPGVEQAVSVACKRFFIYKQMQSIVAPPFLNDWQHFEQVAQTEGFFQDPRSCWWGCRISIHGTVECRIMDLQPDTEVATALSAFIRTRLQMARHGVISPKRVPREELEDQLIAAATQPRSLIDMNVLFAASTAAAQYFSDSTAHYIDRLYR